MRQRLVSGLVASLLIGLPLAAQDQTSGARAQERHRHGHSRLGEA